MGPADAPVVSAASRPKGDLANVPIRKVSVYEGADHFVAPPAESGFGAERSTPARRRCGRSPRGRPATRRPDARAGGRRRCRPGPEGHGGERARWAARGPLGPRDSPCPGTHHARGHVARHDNRHSSSIMGVRSNRLPSQVPGTGRFRVNLGIGRLRYKDLRRAPRPPAETGGRLVRWCDRRAVRPGRGQRVPCRCRHGHRPGARTGVGGHGPLTGRAGGNRIVVDSRAAAGRSPALRSPPHPGTRRRRSGLRRRHHAHHADRLEDSVEVIRTRAGSNAREVTLDPNRCPRETRWGRSGNAGRTARRWHTVCWSGRTVRSAGRAPYP